MLIWKHCEHYQRTARECFDRDLSWWMSKSRKSPNAIDYYRACDRRMRYDLCSCISPSVNTLTIASVVCLLCAEAEWYSVHSVDPIIRVCSRIEENGCGHCS